MKMPTLDRPFDQYYAEFIQAHPLLSAEDAVIGPAALPHQFGARHQQFGLISLNHGELLQYAKSLASHLVDQFQKDYVAAPNNSLVAVYLGHTVDAVAAMLGIMMSGAGFQLLDEVKSKDGNIQALDRFKSYFSEHDYACYPLRYILTTRKLWSSIAEHDLGLRPEIKFIYLDDIINSLRRNPMPDFNSRSQQESLAYLEFSSGTTGNPKGILIAHRGLTSRLISHYQQFRQHGSEMDHTDAVAQLAPFGIDASIMEIMLGLGCGGKVHMIDDEHRLINSRLIQYFNENKVTTAILVPTKWKSIDDNASELKHIKRVITTGEAADAELIGRWLARGILIMNAYGPTEMCFGLTLCVVQLNNIINQTLVSIGTPMLGTTLLIVEADKKIEAKILATITDQGVITTFVEGEISGEIIAIDSHPSIGGHFLKYTNIPNEHCSFMCEISSNGYLFKTGEGLLRAYRTGDIGSIKDNQLFTEGRIDLDQVKKRGQLVKLAEIAHELEAYPLSLGCQYPVFSGVYIAYHSKNQQFVAYLNHENTTLIYDSVASVVKLMAKNKALDEIIVDASDVDLLNYLYAKNEEGATYFKHALIKKLLLAKYPALSLNTELLLIDIRKIAAQKLTNLMLPSRWCLDLDFQYQDKTKLLKEGVHLSAIYRQDAEGSDDTFAGKLTDCVKRAWVEVLDDLDISKINANSHFKELGGDSHGFTIMLNKLKKHLFSSKLLTDDSDVFDNEISFKLLKADVLHEFVEVITPYVVYTAELKRAIMRYREAINRGNRQIYPAIYLFRSPFSVNPGANLSLQNELSLINEVTELTLPCETQPSLQAIDIESQTRWLETMIIEDIDSRPNLKIKNQVVLIGHSAGGSIAYQVGLALAKKNMAVSVIMLDTPSSQLAQNIPLPKYIEYIASCVRKTCEGLNANNITTIMSAYDEKCSTTKVSDKATLIDLIEKLLIEKLPPEHHNKIMVITNSCRAELSNFNYNQAPPKNMRVLIMTSKRYRLNISEKYGYLSDDAIMYLCWPREFFSQESWSIPELLEHDDFVRAEGPLRAIVERVQSFILATKGDLKSAENLESAHNLLNARIDSALKLKKTTFVEPLYTKDNQTTISLYKKIKFDLYADNKKTLVIDGDPGMGKTYFMLILAKKLLSEYDYYADKRLYFPIYIDLKELCHRGFLKPHSDKSFIEAYVELFNINYRDTLRECLLNRNLLLIVDGCDEVDLINVNLHAELTRSLTQSNYSYDCRMVFSCRTESLSADRLSSVYGTVRMRAKRYQLEPFNEVQIEECIKNFVAKSSPDKSFLVFPVDLYQLENIKKIPGLDRLMTNPLLLNMVLEILPDINWAEEDNIKKLEIRPSVYANFFMSWVKRQAVRVISTVKIPGESIDIPEESLVCYAAIYSINLAQQLWEKIGSDTKIHSGALDHGETLLEELLAPSEQTRKTFLSILNNAFGIHNPTLVDYWMENYAHTVRRYHNKSGEDYPVSISDKEYFSGQYQKQPNRLWSKVPDLETVELNKNLRIGIIRSCALLKVCENDLTSKSYQFLHRSIIEFLIDTSLFIDLEDLFDGYTLSLKTNKFSLNTRPIREEPDIVKNLAIRYPLNAEGTAGFIKLLWKIVYSTRFHTGMGVAASNAITILVAIDRFILCNKNLSDIEIPVADISNAFCWNTNFNGANMCDTWIFQTEIPGATFYGCKLSDSPSPTMIKFEERPLGKHMLKKEDIVSMHYWGDSWHLLRTTGKVSNINKKLSAKVPNINKKLIEKNDRNFCPRDLYITQSSPHRLLENILESEVTIIKSYLTSNGYYMMITRESNCFFLSSAYIYDYNGVSENEFRWELFRVRLDYDHIIDFVVNESPYYIGILASRNNSKGLAILQKLNNCDLRETNFLMRGLTLEELDHKNREHTGRLFSISPSGYSLHMQLNYRQILSLSFAPVESGISIDKEEVITTQWPLYEKPIFNIANLSDEASLRRSEKKSISRHEILDMHFLSETMCIVVLRQKGGFHEGKRTIVIKIDMQNNTLVSSAYLPTLIGYVGLKIFSDNNSNLYIARKNVYHGNLHSTLNIYDQALIQQESHDFKFQSIQMVFPRRKSNNIMVIVSSDDRFFYKNKLDLLSGNLQHGSLNFNSFSAAMGGTKLYCMVNAGTQIHTAVLEKGIATGDAFQCLYSASNHYKNNVEIVHVLPESGQILVFSGKNVMRSNIYNNPAENMSRIDNENLTEEYSKAHSVKKIISNDNRFLAVLGHGPHMSFCQLWSELKINEHSYILSALSHSPTAIRVFSSGIPSIIDSPLVRIIQLQDFSCLIGLHEVSYLKYPFNKKPPPYKLAFCFSDKNFDFFIASSKVADFTAYTKGHDNLFYILINTVDTIACYSYACDENAPVKMWDKKLPSRASGIVAKVINGQVFLALTIESRLDLMTLDNKGNFKALAQHIFYFSIMQVEFLNQHNDDLIMAIMTQDALYLLEVKTEGNKYYFNPLYVVGKPRTNLGLAKFQNCYGLIPQQLKDEINESRKKSKEINVLAAQDYIPLNEFFNMAMKNLVKLSPNENVKSILQKAKGASNRQFSITATTWLISHCKKDSFLFNSESNYQLVIEGIHQGFHIAVGAFVKEIKGKMILEIQNLYQDYDRIKLLEQCTITQVNIPVEHGRILIQNLWQDRHLLQTNTSKMNKYQESWLTYVLNTVGLSIQGGRVQRCDLATFINLPTRRNSLFYQRPQHKVIPTSMVSQHRLLTEDTFCITFLFNISKHPDLLIMKEELDDCSVYQLSAQGFQRLHSNIGLHSYLERIEWSVGKAIWMRYEDAILKWHPDQLKSTTNALPITEFKKMLNDLELRLWNCDAQSNAPIDEDFISNFVLL
jgi:non-ribosomal peptide synthetase component F